VLRDFGKPASKRGQEANEGKKSQKAMLLKSKLAKQWGTMQDCMHAKDKKLTGRRMDAAREKEKGQFVALT
jgi:hypothetical protein